MQHNTHDENTPICDICGEHVGVLTPAALLVSGQYVFNRELGTVEFLMDPDTNIQFLEHPDMLGPGRHQLGCLVITDHPTAVNHEECLLEAVQWGRDLDEDDDRPNDYEDEE